MGGCPLITDVITDDDNDDDNDNDNDDDSVACLKGCYFVYGLIFI